MLPNIQSHGHYTELGLLALEMIKRLQQNKSNNIKIPIIIDGSKFVLTEQSTYTINRLADISSITLYEFRFNGTWKLSNSNTISDYQMIVFWTCSKHKSQGSFIAETLTTLARGNEQYFYFNNDLDAETRI